MRLCLSLPVLYEVLSFFTRVVWGSVFLYPCCMRFCLPLPVLYEVLSEALSVNMAYRAYSHITTHTLSDCYYYYYYYYALLQLL